MKTPAANVDLLLKDGTVTIQGAVSEFGLGRTTLYQLMNAGTLHWFKKPGCNREERLLSRWELKQLIAQGGVFGGWRTGVA